MAGKQKRQAKRKARKTAKQGGRNQSNESPRPAYEIPRRWLWGMGVGVGVLLAFGGWQLWRSGNGATQVGGEGAQVKNVTTASMRDEGVLPATMGVSWKEMDNPSDDGWDSEVASQKADKVLKQLAADVASGSPDAQSIARYLADGFTCSKLASVKESVYEDSAFQIRRDDKRPADEDGETYRGADGLIRALHELSVPFNSSAQLICEIKTMGVDLQKDGWETRQLVSIAGRTPTGIAEYNAKWKLKWAPTDPPRIRSIRPEDSEEVQCRSPFGPLFSDLTQPVLGGNEAYREQLLVGLHHWLGRIQDRRQFYFLGNPGLAVGDVNGDGLDDLYLCQEEGLPNRLFLQQPDGSARDVSQAWGVDWLHSSRGVLLVDLDNDDDQDLIVATVGRVIVASNEGQRFQVRRLLPTGEDNMSLSAADFDRDGDLDVYTCVYYPDAELGEKSRADQIVSGAGADAELNGGRNSLFRNDIAVGEEGSTEWSFVDVTAEANLDFNNRRFSFASAWEDFDNDGDQDLYVANDYGRNNLFLNDGGKFTEAAGATGSEDPAFGMSITWGDFNQDGWMDPYVSNMFSSAGHRISFQDQFLAGHPSERATMQRFARGNTLFANLGQGKLSDVSEDAGVTIGRWSWASKYIDVNNDSREDLVVANGFVTTDDTSDL